MGTIILNLTSYSSQESYSSGIPRPRHSLNTVTFSKEFPIVYFNRTDLKTMYLTLSAFISAKHPSLLSTLNNLSGKSTTSDVDQIMVNYLMAFWVFQISTFSIVRRSKNNSLANVSLMIAPLNMIFTAPPLNKHSNWFHFSMESL